MKLFIILKKKKSDNYVWIYKKDINYLIKIGQKNNTQFDYIEVNHDLLQNILISLIELDKTHKYYYSNINLHKIKYNELI